MTKKDYHSMSRKEVRKEYVEKVDDAYIHQGIFAGIGYELKSIGHTIGTYFANLADDAKHPSTDAKGNYHRFGTMGRYERDKATERIRERTEKNREHLLRGPKKGLEKTAATLALLSFVGATLFISGNITGNAIANLSTETNSVIGVVLFILVLLTGFFLLKRKNKVSKKKR